MNAIGWINFQSEINGVMQETTRRYPDELQFIQKGLGLFYIGLSAIPVFKNSDDKIVQFGFLSQSFNSLYSTIDLTNKGLYFQALSNFRFIFESWITYWYVEQYSDEAGRWLEPNKKPPKIETMIKKIEHSSKKIKKIIGDYRTQFSRFVHSDGIAIRNLIEVDHNELVIYLGVKFDKKRYFICCYEITHWTWNMLDALARLIPEKNEWHRDFQLFTVESHNLLDKIQDVVLSKS
jgi:hypothetical protein